MIDEAVIRSTFEDEAFVQFLLTLETPEEVQAALREKKIDFSVDEIKKIRELIVQSAESGKELSEEDLTAVVGGCDPFFVPTALAIMGIALAVSGGAILGGGTITGVASLILVATKVSW